MAPKRAIDELVSLMNEDIGGVLKRPAPAPVSAVLKRPAASSAPPPSKPEHKGSGDQQDDKRNRLKAIAWNKSYDELPAWVKTMWEQTKHSGQKRAKQTEMINVAMVKGAGGRWEIQLDTPTFNELKEKFEESFGEEVTKGVNPNTAHILVWLYVGVY